MSNSKLPMLAIPALAAALALSACAEANAPPPENDTTGNALTDGDDINTAPVTQPEGAVDPDGPDPMKLSAIAETKTLKPPTWTIPGKRWTFPITGNRLTFPKIDPKRDKRSASQHGAFRDASHEGCHSGMVGTLIGRSDTKLTCKPAVRFRQVVVRH